MAHRRQRDLSKRCPGIRTAAASPSPTKRAASGSPAKVPPSGSTTSLAGNPRNNWPSKALRPLSPGVTFSPTASRLATAAFAKGACLGCLQRAKAPRGPPRRRGEYGGVQPRRRPAGHRRRDRVSRSGTRPAGENCAGQPEHDLCAYLRAGVQSRRHPAGHRQRGQKRPGLGRGQRQAAARDPPRRRGDQRWRSARTADGGHRQHEQRPGSGTRPTARSSSGPP